jgi:IS5 family transposase
VRLAQEAGVKLRQSYARVAKRAAIMVGRYSHAHQFKRARRQLKFLHTRLGRVIRDIRGKIDGNAELESRFGPLLDLALCVRFQDHRQRGPKYYAMHAPVGAGDSAQGRPLRAPRPGAPRQSLRRPHSRPVLAALEAPTGVETRRIDVDKDYRGHTHPHKFRVWIRRAASPGRSAAR